MNGLVFDIQRFSIHDGPGIRSTVFLKGCHARCFWCQNPEGLSNHKELQFFRDRCIGCDECFRVCPNNAHAVVEGLHVILRDRCKLCGACVEACPSGALTFAGTEMSAGKVVAILARDKTYYDYSGGGVTLSGGEPLMQAEFSYEVLSLCQQKGIHTAIETTAYGREETFERVLSVTDLVMMDVKHLNLEMHIRGTGVDNERIRHNAQVINRMEKPLIIRVPVVPGFNDLPEDIRAIAEYAASFPTLQYLELLPFHRLGESKYESLGMECRTKDIAMPGKQEMQRLTAAAREAGILVKCAGLRSKPASNPQTVGAGK